MAASERRRTQAERRAETQRRLLDAALACLVEHGYAGTTAARVVARAGVTRGAQSHYYGTMDDLMVAAVQHLAVRRAEQALQHLADVVEAEDPVDRLLDLLWEIHDDDLFTATVELWVAARTDEELRRQVEVVEPTAMGALQGMISTLIDDRTTRHRVASYVYTVMDTVRGLLLGGYPLADPERLAARWQRAKAELRRLADATITDSGVPLEDLIASLVETSDRPTGP